MSFSYPWDQVCSIFSSAGKFYLAHGLRQLTRDFTNDVITLLAGDQSQPFFTITLLYLVTETLCLVILRV